MENQEAVGVWRVGLKAERGGARGRERPILVSGDGCSELVAQTEAGMWLTARCHPYAPTPCLEPCLPGDPPSPRRSANT